MKRVGITLGVLAVVAAFVCGLITIWANVTLPTYEQWGYTAMLVGFGGIVVVMFSAMTGI